MALVDTAWYVNYGDGSAGAGKKSYYDVAQWAATNAYAAAALIRQLTTPAVGSERVFVCIVAGTSLGTEPASWTTTRGGKTVEAAGPTWQECTGVAALNGDATHTATWTITATPPGGVKGTAVTLGQVIKRDNGVSYQICTTAGTAGSGSEPAFSDTAGVTTSDNTVTWTSLGVVGNFTGWQAPHARVANILSTNWGQAGNDVFAADNHGETRATALAWAGAGTYANPIWIWCVDRNGSIPPVAADLRTTATVTTTGASNMALTGAWIANGFIFSCGSGAVSAGITLGGTLNLLKNCALRKAGTTGGAAITLSGPYCELDNVTMQFGSTGDSYRTLQVGTVRWKNTPLAITGATFPTSFHRPAQSTLVETIGVDFSALGSGTTLVDGFNGGGSGITRYRDCKLGANVTLGSNSTQVQPGSRIECIRCDSGATSYRNEVYDYSGTQTTETTIVRTNGALDGATPISWKIVATSTNIWATPFVSLPITIQNTTLAAISTLTFYGTTTGGGVPNNDDIWVEVEYLGSASSPQGSFISTTKTSRLAASVTTNNSADGSTWGGAGAGNGFKIVVPSFTPAMAGPINITIRVAKASATYYIDPRPSISGVQVSNTYSVWPGTMINEVSSDRFSAGLFI